MADKLTKQKLSMWNKKLEELEKKLELVMQQKGEAAQMGDLSENAAYKMAVEEVEVYQTRIAEVQKIISNLEAKKS